MIWMCLEPQRIPKTQRILGSLAMGWRGPVKMTQDEPPDDGNPFVVWGQLWSAMSLIPKALATGRPFWQLDNGSWRPGRGGIEGYYRLNYRGLSPIFLRNATPERAFIAPRMSAWRTTGTHILLALPGEGFGKSIGLDMPKWIEEMRDTLPRLTDRPIIIREKKSKVPLSEHLSDCWALVTHSSNVAVDGVAAGIPVFVAPTNPAAPVGNLDLADLENPVMPGRKEWITSLACQQYTLEEMKNGTAFHYMEMIRTQVDA